MTRVISVLSKKKDQMLEYKKIQNEKFDKKIEDTRLKLQSLEAEKVRFNEDFETRIAELKD